MMPNELRSLAARAEPSSRWTSEARDALLSAADKIENHKSIVSHVYPIDGAPRRINLTIDGRGKADLDLAKGAFGVVPLTSRKRRIAVEIITGIILAAAAVAVAFAVC